MKIPQNVREIMALDSGDDDPWGWGNSHMFAIAETLYIERQPIPEDWHFRTPWTPEQRREHLAESWPDTEYIDAYESGNVTAGDLRTAGNVLTRYLRLVEHAGRAY